MYCFALSIQLYAPRGQELWRHGYSVFFPEDFTYVENIRIHVGNSKTCTVTEISLKAINFIQLWLLLSVDRPGVSLSNIIENIGNHK